MIFFNLIKKIKQPKDNQKGLGKTAGLVVLDADGTGWWGPLFRLPLFRSVSSWVLWKLACILSVRRRNKEAHAIYGILSKRTLAKSKDYLCSGLSEYRLGNALSGITHFENGLKAYPNDKVLRECYLQVCGENGKIERAILFLSNENETLDPVCKNLLQKKDLDFSVKAQVIGFCLKNNFIDLAERELQLIQTSPANPIGLWQLADIFLASGRGRSAKLIWGRLSKLEPTNPTNCSYSALANQRLSDFISAFEIFEKGIKAYPEDNFLRSLYVQACAMQHNYRRYSEFMRQLPGSDYDSAISLVDFYKTIIKSEARLIFLINFKAIEKDCLPTDFELLKQHFLMELAENRVSLQTAKYILFYGKHLDIENDFCSATLEVLKKSFENFNEDSQKIIYSFEILASLTTPMVPHYATDSNKTVMEFIETCKLLASDSTTLTEPLSDLLNDWAWAPWQFIFCSTASAQYRHAMSAFEQFVFATWPELNYRSPHIVERFQAAVQTNKKIKIGFTVHDSIPMMSGLLRQLDKNVFDTVFLHPGEAGSSQTAKNWTISADKIVEYSDVDTLSAIKTIAAQKLDILVSGPSIPAIFFPMMARLAPLQMVLLEPNWTDGMKNTDYYISWRPAEPVKPKDFYQTTVSYLEHPPYWIERPSLDVNLAVSQEARDGIRKRLLNCGPENHVYLCANTPPKIHPLMDKIFADLLEADPEAIIVLFRSEYPPAKTLKVRLQEKLGQDFNRVIFLSTLVQEDAHSLLMAADCCLDSFPLCGMSSSFDAAMLGVPIVTLPFDIPFGRWTAAIYDYIGVSGLTARDQKDYIQLALRLATDVSWRAQKALEIKEKASLYVESRVAFEDLQKFIIEAWNRKLLGLPPGNWIAGAWQES